MLNWIIQLIASHGIFFVYFVLVVFALLEGPILSIAGGVLLRLGFLSFFPLYGCLMLGDLIGDVVWYWIGYKQGYKFMYRFGKYFNITEKNIEKVKEIFHKHKNPILLLSKMTNGMGFAIVVLFTAGMSKIKFSRFMLLNITGQFIWSAMLIGFGFFFSHLYITINNVMGRISLLFVFAIVVLLVLGYKKYLISKLQNTN